MTEKLFIFLIHSSGIIEHGENEIYYEWPPPSTLPLSRGVTFEDLCDRIASTLHINRKDSKLTIWHRFPFQCHPYPVIYQQILLEDDNGVNGIFDMLGCQYGFVGAKLYMDVESIRSHRDVFPIQYDNEGLNASFSYSHGRHFHDPYATHTSHYSEIIAQSPINIGGAEYHAPYTHVATEDQHVPYRPMNTSGADYDNPNKHVAQETTCCFEFEDQYDQIATQRAANDPNDTHRIATTTGNAVHTLSKRMEAMDSDDQLDNDEVLDDVGDEQEPLNEPIQESSLAMAFHQPSSLSFSQNTWDNVIDPTPPFEKPI